MSQPLEPAASAAEAPEIQVPPEIDVSADLERLKSATYTGRDPDHLVTAIVDGDGIVVSIRFATMVGSRAPEAVESAVLAAVATAQERIDDAWRALAARMDPAQPETAGHAAHGGVELAFDPTAEES
jgi:DNA-binding protein YbaB